MINMLKSILNILLIFLSIQPLLCVDIELIQELRSSDIQANDYFGVSVDIDGDYMVVGAQGENGNEGALYVYYWNGVNWTQQAKLKSSIPETNSSFGFWVRIEGDVIVTSDTYQSLGGTWRGAVYIFEKPSGGWVDATETTYLQASDVEDNSLFGASIDINGDRIAVGRTWRDGIGSRRGSVYIFKKNGASWVNNIQEAILTPSGVANNLYLGYQVILDDNYVYASAIGYNSGAGGVYVFKNNSSTWEDKEEDLILTASDAQNSDGFGERIFFSDNLLVVTATGEDGAGTDRGAAYVFEGYGLNWNETSSNIKLTASDASDNDRLGIGLFVMNKKIYVSSIYHDGSGTDLGKLYVFEEGDGWTSKNEDYSYSESGLQNGDIFGTSISGKTGLLIVGAQSSDKYFTNGGNVYVNNLFEKPEVENFEINSYTNSSIGFEYSVYDGGKETNISIEYGEESGVYNNELSLGSVDSLYSFVNLNSELDGLQLSNQYFVRIKAENSVGIGYSNELNFYASRNQNDYDDDGSDNETEQSSPNGGDANNDGLADYLQVSVASFLEYNGAGYITISSVDGSRIYESESINFTENGYIYPYGQIGFKIDASQAEVDILYHFIDNLEGYEYRKNYSDNIKRIQENTSFSFIEINGNQVAKVRLRLFDGGSGDFDRELNGVIYDPGGPALPISANIPYWDWRYMVLLGLILIIGLWRKIV